MDIFKTKCVILSFLVFCSKHFFVFTLSFLSVLSFYLTIFSSSLFVRVSIFSANLILSSSEIGKREKKPPKISLLLGAKLIFLGEGCGNNMIYLLIFFYRKRALMRLW